MIRPATPLTVMLFAAFVMLLLSVLSTPLIKGVPLGSFKGYNFGVFGYCRPDGSCTGVELGYDTSSFFSSTESATFDLPGSTRATLSTVLVLHPVAAFLTLVMLILAITAHFHSASHSARYLLLVFIISIFTFLAALLAFLIDILLFVPHMAWGTFIVLAAVILIGLSSIVACAMRRTVVGRKSRQRRIAANAEMSGENFYNRQAQTAAAVNAANASSVMAESQSPAPRQPALPRIGGPGSNGDSFEKGDAASSDEQIPLTSQPAQLSNRYSQQRNQYGGGSPEAMMMSGAAGAAAGAAVGAAAGQRRSIQRDAYGNPLPYGSNPASPPPQEYGVRHGPSVERMNNMSPGQRGRGGGPGPGYRGGRGGGPGYSPYGPGPGGRGGYGPPGGRGGYGGPPPNGRGRGGYGGRGGYAGPGRGRTPPPGYRYDQAEAYSGGTRGSPGPNGYYGNPSGTSLNDGGMGGGNGYTAYRNEIPSSTSGDLPRAESPPPLPDNIGVANVSAASPRDQAVEMDATTPQPQHQQVSRFAEADDDIAGMVSLQQGRTSQVSEAGSTGQYLPPRAAWKAQNGSAANSPVHGASELPEDRPATSEAYIEDVDPRFAEPQQSGLAAQPRKNLQPLAMNANNNSYEDMPQGSRSPAESERSTFTSISQRGINPRWNPPPPNLMPGYGGGMGGIVPRRPVRDTNETLLNSNPDFSLRAGGRRPPGGPQGPSTSTSGGTSGMIPGSAYPAL
ncbi:pH signal transduction protein [Sporothrix brasiliensis 5110]|uniref:pH signal transduction protein n=1 Tax=Sporothrix brasiliensis 5110 TaxID=1398154 RepID=A0A0C2F6U2_9PEZI|nr:pH signal transduction protein [Sporothrix brasiliensis 5110]KIH94639.1 pH signal transduction protein [Sporothrix brasiliensis 5110]